MTQENANESSSTLTEYYSSFSFLFSFKLCLLLLLLQVGCRARSNYLSQVGFNCFVFQCDLDFFSCDRYIRCDYRSEFVDNPTRLYCYELLYSIIIFVLVTHSVKWSYAFRSTRWCSVLSIFLSRSRSRVSVRSIRMNFAVASIVTEVFFLLFGSFSFAT